VISPLTGFWFRALIFAALLLTGARADQDSSTNAPASVPPVNALVATAAPTNAPPARPPMDAKKLVNKLVYQIEPCVFGTNEFPTGAFQQDAMVQAVLGPVTVATTFYNEKFEQVKSAAMPGRYGAVVRATLADGTTKTYFITLYRVPDGAATQTVNVGKYSIPIETGTSPDVAARQQAEIAIALKGVIGGDSGPVGFGLLLGVAKVMPGITPDQLLSSFMTYMAREDAWWFDLRKRLGLEESYNYETDLPEGYEADATKHWPLILFLHGSGDRGIEVPSVAFHGLPKFLTPGTKLPAVLISPRCPDEWWSAPVLGKLLDDVSAKYRIDPDRISVTGASMGGFGTWALAEAYPGRFSAIAPICGGGNPAGAASLTKLPIWTFHGMLDTTVPVFLTRNMVAALQKAGGTPHFTIYPTTKHDAWKQAYTTDALFTWMLAQQRGQPEVKTPGLPEP